MEGPFTEMEKIGKRRLLWVESGWIWISLEHATLLLKTQWLTLHLSTEWSPFHSLLDPAPTWSLLLLQTHLSPPSLLSCFSSLVIPKKNQHQSAFGLLHWLPHPGIFTTTTPNLCHHGSLPHFLQVCTQMPAHQRGLSWPPHTSPTVLPPACFLFLTSLYFPAFMFLIVLPGPNVYVFMVYILLFYF